MQILELEEKYSELKSDLNGQYSKRTKLLKISEYLGFALSTTNSHLIEPYIIDLIPVFLKYAIELEIRGIQPNDIQTLIEQTNQLKDLKLNGIEISEFDQVIHSLQYKLSLMNDWLNSGQLTHVQTKIFFPLLEKNDDDLGAGYLESVSIIIKNGEQKFHISPADLENDQQLEKQIQLCFNKAIEYCSHFRKKIKKSHTVYLHFENRLGILTGNSLGAALTLSFIEAILKNYNSPIVVNINKILAITGGVDSNSNIKSTSKTIVEAKVETAFFSDVELMCVPKIDEIWAEEKLKQLKEKYPKRNLTLLGIADLNDLLDRRQVVEIRKQKLIIRTGKFVKKNWLSAVATVFLAILFAYLFVMDFDDNPNSYSLDGRKVYIKNKKGRILWEQPLNTSNEVLQNPVVQAGQIRIINIDNDKMNEVLFVPTSSDDVKRIEGGTELICFTYDQKIKWRYSFYDKIHSIREDIDTIYSIRLFDTLTVEKSKRLFLLVNNIHSFSSAIISLDLNTGKRLHGTIWMSGATVAGLIKDINNDNQPDIIALGWDNGYEDICLFGFEPKNNEVVRASTKTYQILDYPIATHLFCVRVPKTDFDNYYEHRTPGLGSDLLYNNYEPSVNFFVGGVSDKTTAGYGISFDKNFLVKRINIANDFRVRRDTLVANGKLKSPYTDTEEYKNIIMDNILYWKDGKWVNRKGEIKE